MRKPLKYETWCYEFDRDTRAASKEYGGATAFVRPTDEEDFDQEIRSRLDFKSIEKRFGVKLDEPVECHMTLRDGSEADLTRILDELGMVQLRPRKKR